MYNKRGEERQILPYLPSKKIIYSVIPVLFVIAGLFWFLKYGPQKESSKNLYVRNLESIAGQFNDKDSDGDGLKDWEEILWKTDINKIDSDNDGFSDKEEMETGYDPMDFSSNPKTGKKTENISQLNFLEPVRNVNLTQELATSMGVKVASLREDSTQDFSNILGMVDKSTSQDLAEFIASFNRQISEKELKISNDNSAEAVKKYSGEISKAIPQNPYPQKREDDIFADAMQTKDFKIIDEYIQYYSQSIINTKNIVVPSDFVLIHKKEIELFMATQKVFENIKEVDTDPLKTVLALQQYERIRNEMKDLVIDYLNLVQKHSQ